MYAAALRLSPFALTLGVLACRPAPVPADGTVTLAVRADLIEFFPNGTQSDSYTMGLNTSLFEGLVGLDAELRLRPQLAERWESPDEFTYLFTLRPGLRFSDGTPVTAADVAASLDAVSRNRWETRDYLRPVESVRAIGARQVEIRTRAVSLGLLTRLPWGWVLPARLLEHKPVPPVGTGPYALEAHLPGREFVLRRNAHFHGPAPAFERARFVVLPDEAARVTQVAQGAADLADQVSPSTAARFAGRSDVRVVRQAGPQTLFLGLRVDRPPLSDPRVREALDLALDRRALIEAALGGAAEPASQAVSVNILGHNPELRGTALDQQRARQLLAAAGWREGLTLRLDAPDNRYPGDVRIAAEVARQLALVGVRVEPNTLEKERFFELIDSGQSDFHLLGWTCLSGDAGDLLDSLAHSRTADGFGQWNTVGLADPGLDRLIEQSARATVDSERAAHLKAAMARLGELRAVLPLATPHEIFLVSNRIEWAPRFDAALRPADMRPGRR